MRKYWLVILLLVSAFFFYLPSIGLYFAADDFFYTSFLDIRQTVEFFPGLYHYSPVFWFFMFLLRNLAGLNSWFFHLTALILHLINISLVYFLGKLVFKNNQKAFLSTLLYAFFFSHYEVVYWVTGIDTSLMTILYLCGLNFYIRFTKRRKVIYLLFFNLFTLLALLTHEYAITLPVTAFLYETFLIQKMKIKKIFQYQIPFFIMIFILFFLKVIIFQTSLTVTSFSFEQFLISIVKSLVYLTIPVPQIIDNLPRIFVILLFSIITISYLRLIKDKIAFWLVIWLVITVSLFSSTSVPQARYFYLSAVPATLLISYILNINLGDLMVWPKYCFVILILFFGIFFLKKQESNWMLSSQIIRNTVFSIKETSNKVDMLFLNLPDSINGPPWNIYVFRGGLESPLRSNGIPIGKITYGRTSSLNGIIRDDIFYSKENVYEFLKIGKEIYVYDDRILSIRRINNENDINYQCKNCR